MLSLRVMPTQKYVDAQLKKISAVRIGYPITGDHGSLQQSVFIELTAERRAQLRNALCLREDKVPISCHCPGTVSIELIRNLLPNIALILHLHRQAHSLWLPKNPIGVSLCDGQQILRLLAEWGVQGPLETVVESYRDQTRRGPTAAAIAELQRPCDEHGLSNKQDADVAETKHGKNKK